MNAEALEVLIQQLKADGLTTAEQVRALARLSEQVNAEIVDVLDIVADRLESEEDGEAGTEAGE